MKMGRKKQTFCKLFSKCFLFSFHFHSFAEYILQILIIYLHLSHIQNHVQDTHEIRTNQNQHCYILLPPWLFINPISLQFNVFTIFLLSNTSALQKSNNQFQFKDHVACLSLNLFLLLSNLHILYIAAYN